MARGESRREAMRKLSEFGGEDVLVDLAADLEKDNEGLRRALARADARHAEVVRERDEAIRKAAAADARCGQIPTWRRLAEDLSSALTMEDLSNLQARARILLLAVVKGQEGT